VARESAGALRRDVISSSRVRRGADHKVLES